MLVRRRPQPYGGPDCGLSDDRSSNAMRSLAFLRPCVSTHVARTGEIGRASVTGIEKKGKINRRVRIALGAP
jgi:Threonyl and Alanyl tRNA synthetase second additional domain